MSLIIGLAAATSMYFAAGPGAPIEQLWLVEYNGPVNEQDSIERILADAGGNALVIGQSAQSGFDTDILAAKYAPDGSLLWFRTWDSPTGGNDYGAAAALDSAGNLHVAGYYYGGPANTTIAVLKYDAAGNLLWWQNYWIATGNAAHISSDLALDDDGNVYIAGYSSTFGTPGNTLLLKYDAAGNLIWTRSFNGSANGWDQFRHVAVDGTGNIVASGRTEVGSFNDDIGVWKYAPNGDLLWFQSFDSGASSWDQVAAMAIGPEDSIYMSGWGVPTGQSGDLDGVVFKYGSDGALLWQAWYANPALGEDQFFALSLDADGNAYAAGAAETTDSYREYLTMKIDSSGVEQWIRLHGEPFEGGDEAATVDVDAQGNVLVAGYSEHLLEGGLRFGGGPPIEEGFRFVSYDPAGTLRYESFHALGGGHYIKDVATLAGGEFVAAGSFSTETTQNDFFVGKWRELGDCNGNGQSDEIDIANGTSQDCNGNQVPDECDIAAGTALDCNGNGVPDECDFIDGTLTDADGSGVADECEAAGDLNGDGGVSGADLGEILGVWGRCEDCPADLNNDGVVDGADLGIMLSNWTG